MLQLSNEPKIKLIDQIFPIGISVLLNKIMSKLGLVIFSVDLKWLYLGVQVTD